MSEKTLLEACW